MSEPLAALLTLPAFWLAVRDRERGRGARRAGALVLGVAALVRPQALLCAPFLARAFASRSSRRAREARSAGDAARARSCALAIAVACALALVPVLPWTARNCRVMDGCALVSTNAGWNLAIGAFPRATGRFETLRSSDGCREVTGQVQQDRCWLHYGIARDRRAPVALARARAREARLHLRPRVVRGRVPPRGAPRSVAGRRARARARGDDVRASPSSGGGGARRRGVRRAAPAAPADARVRSPRARSSRSRPRSARSPSPARRPSFWPLAIFAAVVPWLPLAGTRRERPRWRMALGLLATTIATHAVFFGEDRYHVVVTPVLALLAAAALRAPAPPLPAGRAANVVESPT